MFFPVEIEVNPILVEAIRTLSAVVNVSTGLAHPLDESKAKELFKALHKHGVPLRSSDVYSLATGKSWPDRHAKKLAEMAEKVGNGGLVQIKHSCNWGEPTVKRIIAELGQTEQSNARGASYIAPFLWCRYALLPQK